MKTTIRKIALTAFVASFATTVSMAQDSAEATADGPIIELETFLVEGKETFAARAVEGVTPVSFSTVDKDQILKQLGSRDIPLVLDTTPSVYATPQGGGPGDARINVRGFNQRNVAVMINGIPQNDMENGWVYWSNWDGVGDAASSIQVQRGLSNVNLATPSVGGTLNILTDPASQDMGASIRQEFGTGNFLKTTVQAHTGLINDTFAFSATVVRKTVDDYAHIDKAWSDAWAYYFDAAYIINDSNKLQLTILGAPQRHGQNLYEHNVAEYDQEFARKIGADPASFARYPEQGRNWNENWSPIVSSYKGKQHFDGQQINRHEENYIMERENYFHKPVVSLVHGFDPSDTVNLTSSLYWSGGTGGGTGTYGSTRSFDGSRPGFGAYQFAAQATYERNISNEDGSSSGILRNSVNRQWTWGAISKLTITPTDSLTFQAGLDWRTAEIKHFREVRDLLGGSYYWERNSNNDFWQNDSGYTRVGLGDKIGYNNKNLVDWVGFYGQAEYDTDKFNLFGMFGWSSIKYGHENYFRSTTGGPDGSIVRVESDDLDGYQIKGGARFSITDELDVYGNFGFFDKQPIVDGVLNDSSSTINPDPLNEQITSMEVGLNYSDADGIWAVDGNFYYTTWEDRTVTRGIEIAPGVDGLASFDGLNQRHMGVEIEGTYMPIDQLRFDAAFSIGNWEYTDDVSGSVFNYDNSSEVDVNFYTEGLKVGDAPQKQFVIQSTYTPFDGFEFNLVGKWNGDMYAEFDPESRTNPDDRMQSWKTPSYWVFDAHINWNTTVDTPWAPLEVTFFLHVYNVWDETYVAEATDNDRYNAFDQDHDADDAGVYLGLQRHWNTGFTVRF